MSQPVGTATATPVARPTPTPTRTPTPTPTPTTPAPQPTPVDTVTLSGSPDSQEISRIASQEETGDGQRNAQITGEYARLADEMGSLLGPDAGASWVNYAAFASNEVGKGIRGETSVDVLGVEMTPTPEQKEALAAGNREVFAEIAPLFQSFIDTFSQQPPDREAFYAQFQPGQELLRSAFENYERAMAETDPRRKQELTLLANLQIAEHEQVRLQDELEGGKDADGVLGFFQDVANRFGGTADGIVNDAIGFEIGGGQRFPVGQDVPASQDPGNRVRDFNQLENQELKGFIDGWRVEGSHSSDSASLEGSGAQPWWDLGERMYWLCQMMSQQHTNPALFDFSGLHTTTTPDFGGGGGVGFG